MAEDIKKIEGELKRIMALMGKFGLNGAKAAYTELEKAYAGVLKGEDLVIKALPDARKAGVTGDDLKSFVRDPAFKKVFKEYDKTVDELDRAEKVCYAITHNGDQIVSDLETLETRIRKEFKDLKAKDVAALLKDIATTKKRAADAADLYDMKGRDKKMHEYATKFEKRVQFMLDLAPKSEAPEELPSELDDGALKAAEKLALKQSKDAEAVAKKVTTVIKSVVPFSRKADLLLQKEVGDLEKTHKQMEDAVKHFEKLIKTNQKVIQRGHEAVDIKAFMTRLEARTDSVGAILKELRGDLSDAQKTMG